MTQADNTPTEHPTNLADTIVAPAWPIVEHIRAAVRLSGPSAIHAAQSILSDLPTAPGVYTPRLTTPIPVTTITIVARAPRSYTGEDLVEIQFPANTHLRQHILTSLISFDDVRPARPGEFSARAYLNNKLSAEDADALPALLAAHTQSDLQAARNASESRQLHTIDAAAESLADLAALVEAAIDFTEEEDITAIPPHQLTQDLNKIKQTLNDWHTSAAQPIDQDTPRIVLVGPPNAGKSTLFNALLDRPRALVSDLPGTTRDAIEQPIDLPPAPTRCALLVDLAGLDAALADSAPLEHAAQSRARSAIARATLAIACDPSANFHWLNGTIPNRLPRVLVRTKADRPPPANPPAQQTPIIDLCAIDHRGLDTLRQALRRTLDTTNPPSAALVHTRDLSAVDLATTHIDHALHHAANAEGDELTAAAIRAALDALGTIVGPRSPDDVLGRIYARFCLGK